MCICLYVIVSVSGFDYWLWPVSFFSEHNEVALSLKVELNVYGRPILYVSSCSEQFWSKFEWIVKKILQSTTNEIMMMTEELM